MTYSNNAEGWMLSVVDDGVGLPKDRAKVKPGLGTNIVKAIAAQLRGTVIVADEEPGTSVSVIQARLAPGA